MTLLPARIQTQDPPARTAPRSGEEDPRIAGFVRIAYRRMENDTPRLNLFKKTVFFLTKN